MTVDIKLLVEWLGPSGAIAGLQESDLTVIDLKQLAEDSGLSADSRPRRNDLIQLLVKGQARKIDKTIDDLLSLGYEELKAYFENIKPSREELLRILTELDIRPSSEAKKSLANFAAREISDIGMYSRVAKGKKNED